MIKRDIAGDICTSAKIRESCYVAPRASYKLWKFGTNTMIFKEDKRKNAKSDPRSGSRSRSRSRSLKFLSALRLGVISKYLKFQLHILGRFCCDPVHIWASFGIPDAQFGNKWVKRACASYVAYVQTASDFIAFFYRTWYGVLTFQISYNSAQQLKSYSGLKFRTLRPCQGQGRASRSLKFLRLVHLIVI